MRSTLMSSSRMDSWLSEGDAGRARPNAWPSRVVSWTSMIAPNSISRTRGSSGPRARRPTPAPRLTAGVRCLSTIAAVTVPRGAAAPADALGNGVGIILELRCDPCRTVRGSRCNLVRARPNVLVSPERADRSRSPNAEVRRTAPGCSRIVSCVSTAWSDFRGVLGKDGRRLLRGAGYDVRAEPRQPRPYLTRDREEQARKLLRRTPGPQLTPPEQRETTPDYFKKCPLRPRQTTPQRLSSPAALRVHRNWAVRLTPMIVLYCSSVFWSKVASRCSPTLLATTCSVPKRSVKTIGMKIDLKPEDAMRDRCDLHAIVSG
jgi:hypothetical protein